MSAAMAMNTSPSRAKLTSVESGVRQRQRRPGDSLEGIEISITRRVDHPGGEWGRRRLTIPPARATLAIEIVAERLLVEARLRPARRVDVGGPEARAVGCEHFVDQADHP